MPPLKMSSILVLVEPDGAVAQALFEYPENAKYRRIGPARDASTDDGDDSDDVDVDRSAQIVKFDRFANTHLALSFDPGPKDLSRGFVFGSDPETCDVLIAKTNISGVSGNHFSINVAWDSGNPFITCLSSNEGTGIHLWSRSDDIWKVYLRATGEEIEPDTAKTIRIAGGMRLKVYNPARNGTESVYSRNLRKYFNNCQDAFPEMRHMRLYDPEQTPRMINRTRGLTGREYITTSTTVGDKVVLCKAKGHQDWTDGSEEFVIIRYRNTSTRWHDHARTKLTFLRALRHRHIITPEDIITDRTEWMPVYLSQPQVNLADKLARGPLTEGDAGQVLAQIFEGLKYLHEHGIVHGCICPGSIMIEHSSPWSIKLSDIGLYPYVEFEDQKERAFYATQKDRSSRRPEVVWDTWSAGVVGLELLSSAGLPSRSTGRNLTQHEWVIKVASHAIDFRNAEKTSPEGKKEAASFLTRVLEVEPTTELTAEQCLEDPWLQPWRLPPSYYSRDEPQHPIVISDESENEERSGDETRTEDPRSSISQRKQPLYALRTVVASSGHQQRQQSTTPRNPISKSKQPTTTPRSPISKGKQSPNARRPSVTSPGSQPRRRSSTTQSFPGSPSSPTGSRHSVGEPSVKHEYGG